MFGGGFGGGYRNPQMRYIRLGLLAAVLFAGVAFGHSGRSYEILRGLYLVVVVGGILYSLSRRSARTRGGLPGRGGGMGLPGSRPGGSGTWGGSTPFPGDTVDVRTVPNEPPSATFGQGAGWFPDPSDAQVERYWDGSNWSQSRPRDPGTPAGS